MRGVAGWTFSKLRPQHETSATDGAVLAPKKWNSYNVTMFTVGVVSVILSTIGISFAVASATGAFSSPSDPVTVLLQNNGTVIVIQPSTATTNLSLNLTI